MEFWVGGAGYTVWLLDLWPLGAHKLLLNHTDSEYTFGIGFSCEKINVSISKSKTYGNPIPKVVYHYLCDLELVCLLPKARKNMWVYKKKNWEHKVLKIVCKIKCDHKKWGFTLK